MNRLLFDIYYSDMLVARAFTVEDAVLCAKGILTDPIYNKTDKFLIKKAGKVLFEILKDKEIVIKQQ